MGALKNLKKRNIKELLGVGKSIFGAGGLQYEFHVLEIFSLFVSFLPKTIFMN